MFKCFFVTWALLLAPALCQATDPTFYFGASIGQSVEVNAPGGLSGSSDDPSFTLFGGIELGEHFAAEVGYHDFRTTTCCGEVQPDRGFERSADAFSASAVALWPIDRFRLFAKAGALFWKADGHDMTIEGPQPYSNDGVDLIAGLGGDVAVTDGLRIRVEWNRLQIDGNDLDSVSIGALWRF